MLRHSALFAIATTAIVGLTMLAPTNASARLGGPGGGAHFRVAHVGHPGFYNRRFFVARRVVVNRFVFNRRFVFRGPIYGYNWRWRVGGFCWRHPFYCRTHFGGYRVGVPVVRPVPFVAAPALPAAGCLRQIRLADGSSLFRNLCSNEAAITSNPPPDAEPPAPLK
jgi:hypothetical protein